LDWFERCGFSARPTEPVIKYDYFGEDADPVEQFRLEAYDGWSTRATIRDLARPSQFDIEVIDK
jgi:hypothetical protein